MAEKTLTIGAPSLTGEDVHAKVKELFEAAKYPLTVTFTNSMPCAACFPEVDGLYLKHVAATDGQSRALAVPDYDTLQRVSSSIAQIAELNHYNPAMTLAATVEDPAPAHDQSSGGNADQGAEGTDKKDETQTETPETPAAKSRAVKAKKETA